MDDFWLKFKDSAGNNLCYTGVLNRLSQIRIAENIELAQRAKDEYGEKFAEIFRYRKSGKWVPKTKASQIAKQYRILHGMDLGIEDDE